MYKEGLLDEQGNRFSEEMAGVIEGEASVAAVHSLTAAAVYTAYGPNASFPHPCTAQCPTCETSNSRMFSFRTGRPHLCQPPTPSTFHVRRPHHTHTSNHVRLLPPLLQPHSGSVSLLSPRYPSSLSHNSSPPPNSTDFAHPAALRNPVFISSSVRPTVVSSSR